MIDYPSEALADSPFWCSIILDLTASSSRNIEWLNDATGAADSLKFIVNNIKRVGATDHSTVSLITVMGDLLKSSGKESTI